MSHEAKEPDHVRASKAKRALDQVGADRLLNDAESAALLAIGVSSLWRHTRSTLDFPQPVRFGRTVRWCQWRRNFRPSGRRKSRPLVLSGT
jgi:predicted DNA-binding transcriptional regulator AlpA